MSTADFGARYENELANEYGNLVNRTLAMVHRYRDGQVPAVELDELGDVAVLPRDVPALMDVPDPSAALERVWQSVRALNRYVEERAPWKAAKDPERAAELDETLATLVAGVRAVTVELTPFLPESAAAVLARLDADRLEAPPPLFPKQQPAAA